MLAAHLGLAPNQAGHDAVCSSAREGVITTPTIFGFAENCNFFGDQGNGNQVFFRREKSLKLPLLSLMIICLKKTQIMVA